MDTGNRALQWLAESLGPYAPRLIGALTIALAAWLAARFNQPFVVADNPMAAMAGHEALVALQQLPEPVARA